MVLDPDTAHPNIVLSADGKQAGRGELLHVLPDIPQRFDPVICVLGKRGFLSGRFYFQVGVLSLISIMYHKTYENGTMGILMLALKFKNGLLFLSDIGFYPSPKINVLFCFGSVGLIITLSSIGLVFCNLGTSELFDGEVKS